MKPSTIPLTLRLYRRYLQAPDHPSKLRVIRFLERKLIPSNGGIFTVAKNFRMYLHPRDESEYTLIRTGLYEPLTLSFLERNVKPGEKILLAGVNFGLHVMLCSRSVGESGCVIGVEPQPASLRRTSQNISLNNLPSNIKLVSGGLGCRREIIPMAEAPSANTGQASIVLRDVGSHPYYVQVDSLPNLLDCLDIDHLDLMLLDVEGYELPVLEGMMNGPKPSVLVLEIHPIVLRYIKTDPSAYYSAVHKLGYECFNLYGETAKPGDELPENNLIGVLSKAAEPYWLSRD